MAVYRYYEYSGLRYAGLESGEALIGKGMMAYWLPVLSLGEVHSCTSHYGTLYVTDRRVFFRTMWSGYVEFELRLPEIRGFSVGRRGFFTQVTLHTREGEALVHRLFRQEDAGLAPAGGRRGAVGLERGGSVMTNEERAEALIRALGFDFAAISKERIQALLQREIEEFQEGSSEYIRLLCGYLFCLGDAADVSLLEKAKYGVNFDVGCMVDGEWIDSLKNGGRETGGDAASDQ